MKKENHNFIDFIEAYKKLNNSFEALFNGSFNKNLVNENIQLVINKRYAITDEIWNINEGKNNEFLSSFIQLTNSYAKEYEDDIKKIVRQSAYKNNFPLSKQFTIDVLTNKAKKIIDFARINGLADDFVIFFSVFISLPYRKAVANFVKSKINLKEHISGFCPVCGHWPAMSYLVGNEGRKLMSCLCCGTTWSFRRLICSFCLTTGNETLGFLEIEGQNEITAYTCDNCRRYVKCKRIEENITEVPMEEIIMDYLCSGDMDIAAMQNKYVQEPVLLTRFQGPDDQYLDLYLEKLLK